MFGEKGVLHIVLGLFNRTLHGELIGANLVKLKAGKKYFEKSLALVSRIGIVSTFFL